MRKGNGPSPYQKELAAVTPLVLARAGDLCEAKLSSCQGRVSTVHHRKRRTQGGANSMANLMAVCWWCHQWIHDHPSESYDRGLMLRRHEEETLVAWHLL